MVKAKQKSKTKNQKAKGLLGSCSLLLALCFLPFDFAFPQQPQAQSGQPIYAVNAKYVQGVGPGYWPTKGSGLTLNVAAGTAFCGSPPMKVDYAGGTLTMTNAATNYVYLDPASSCAPASNTTGFTAGVIPLAEVVAVDGTITGVRDVRTWFLPQPVAMDSSGRAVLKGDLDIGTAIPPTNPATFGYPIFTGSGLDDLYQWENQDRTYTGTDPSATYTVQIDSVGATDTFRWRKNNGSWTTGVAITGGDQDLVDGARVKFGAVTGHTLNDQWVIPVVVDTFMRASSRFFAGDDPSTLNRTDTKTYYDDDPKRASWLVRSAGPERTTPSYAGGALFDSDTAGGAAAFVGAITAVNPPGATKEYVAALEGDAYSDAAGNVTNVSGVAAYAQLTGSGSVSKLSSFLAWTNNWETNPNIGINAGVYVQDQHGVGQLNAAIYLDDQGTGTADYAIYSNGGQSYFGGKVGIGKVPGANVQLDVAKAIVSGLNVVTFSSTPTFDASLGNTQKITLSGNVTSSTLSNATAGQTINFLICQDATGSRTFVWPTNFLNAPSINSGPNQCKGASFVFDGTNGVHLE